MPKVYIINDMNHNFDKAAKYGELSVVTEGKVPIFKTDVATNILEDKLHDFSNDDFLLVSGPAVLCMMATLVITRRWAMRYTRKPHIKTLVFDAKEQDYVVRHLEV